MKRIIAFLLMIVLCCLVVACSSNTSGKDSPVNTIEDTTPDVTEMVESNKDTETIEITNEPDITMINLSDTITTDFMEMTFNDIQITERLGCDVNSRGDSVILAEVVEGKKVAYFSGEIKNIHTDSIGNVYSGNDCIWGNICFDDKYTYDFKMYIQNGENMEGKITPFSTGTYYLYAHIPNELLESYTSCTLNFGFCENLEAYDSSYGTGFSFDECEYKYSLTSTK